MKDFLQSLSSFSLAMALFPIRQIDNLFAAPDHGDGRSPAVHAMDAVTSATTGQFDGNLRSTFSSLDRFQRGLINVAVTTVWPFGSREPVNHDSHNNGDRSSNGTVSANPTVVTHEHKPKAGSRLETHDRTVEI